MGLYTIRDTQEIVRTALVDADNANEAKMMYLNFRHPGNGRVDVLSNTDERHIIVKEYEEEKK